jgi:DNA-directed RNA polymerase specialized sigma24 family protein
MALSSGDGVRDPDAADADAVQPHEVSRLAKPPVDPSDVVGLGSTPDTKEAGERKEDIDRRLADEALISKFAAENFAGPAYHHFQIELVRYGLAVMRAWLYSGKIFALLNERGMPLHPTSWELELLRRDPDARGEIADFTIARTIEVFEDKALRQGGWKASGGASLPTYFMGSSIYQVRNPFRQWRRHEQKSARVELTEAPAHLPSRPVRDPAIQLCDRDVMSRALECLTPPQRHALQLTMVGYQQSEIAVLLGVPSERAAEGLVRRARLRVKQYLKEHQDGGQ